MIALRALLWVSWVGSVKGPLINPAAEKKTAGVASGIRTHRFRQKGTGLWLSPESNYFSLVSWGVVAASADPLQGTTCALTPTVWSNRGWYGPVCPLEAEVVHWELTEMLFSPWIITTFFEQLFWLVTLGLHEFGGKLFELHVKGLELKSGYSIW